MQMGFGWLGRQAFPKYMFVQTKIFNDGLKLIRTIDAVQRIACSRVGRHNVKTVTANKSQHRLAQHTHNTHTQISYLNVKQWLLLHGNNTNKCLHNQVIMQCK